MKYKIKNVNPPINEEELQKVKDAKDFNRGLIKLVASTVSSMVGMTMYTSSFAIKDDLAVIPITLGVLMQFVSNYKVYKSVVHLTELYDKKGNEQIIDNTLSEGVQR